MSPVSRAVDVAIQQYQQRVSPRKGWSCAHRVAHGGTSCSAEVRDIVRRRGVVRGILPTARRFAACYGAVSLLRTGGVQGVCCCGPIPIPFRF